MIDLKNVKKVYTTKRGLKTTALKGVDLSFGDSGLVFILGKSGCGKSTLLNLIGGIDRPTSGEIVIDGVSSKQFTPADYDAYRNTYVGFVFQDYNLIAEYSVSQNIAVALELQRKKADKKLINEVLKKVNLTDESGVSLGKRRVTELSGGQKQRVAIARALVKNPKVILADEPTGALDGKTGEALYELLKELSKDKLIIVVTHDRDGAFKYGDRVIELVDGKVVRDDGGQVPVSAAEGKKSNYIRSKLPVRRALIMGANGLRHKVFRLILSIVLCVSTFIAFGFSVTALTIDAYDTQLATMRANGLQLFGITSLNYEYVEEDDGSFSINVISFSEKQMEAMRKYLGAEPIKLCQADGIYRDEDGRRLYGIEPFLGADASVLEQLKYDKPYYSLTMSGLEVLAELDSLTGEADANLRADSRFKNNKLCRLPQTDEEIAITDLQFELFAEFGYKEDDGSVIRIRTPDDLIGKKLGRFTICGVYSTEMDSSYFVENKEVVNGYVDDETRQLFYSASASVINFGFVGEGALGDTQALQYMLKTEGGASELKAMIKEMTYTEGDKEYGAEVKTLYSIFLPDEDFYNDVVEIAVIASVVLSVFAILLFMSFLSASLENRKKELAILRALGASKNDVLSICLFESLIIACINFVLALLGVFLAVAKLNSTFYLSFFNVGFLQIFALFLICFGVAALATILPVYKTIRRQPVEVIKENKR